MRFLHASWFWSAALCGLVGVVQAADDWTTYAFVSDTLGVSGGRLCVGEASRGDIGCPSYAPSLTTAGDVSVTGNLSAAAFIGDGSGLTGLSANADRITSGTTNITAASNQSLTFTTAGSQRMVIGENGYVGIGTASPSSTLNIVGYNNVKFNNPSSNSWNINIDSLLPVWMQNISVLSLGYNYGQVRIAEISGRVWLGPKGSTSAVAVGMDLNTAPTATLQVSGSLIVSTSAQTTTPSLYVGTNGFVGVGTSSPQTNVHSAVNSNAYAFYATAPAANNGYAGIRMASNRDVTPYYGAVSMDNSGNLVVGNITSGRLYLDGYNGWTFREVGASYATRMVINAGGNVGISTTAPNAKLDVYGTVSATNFVGDGSGLTGVVAGSSDRIVSGTTSLLAVSSTGYVSLTQAGVNTGWFDPARGLVTLGVSSTGGISGTSGYFSGNLGVGTVASSDRLAIGSTSDGARPVLSINSLGGGWEQKIKFRTTNDNYGFTIQAGNAGSNSLRFIRHQNDSTGVTAMAIDQLSGNVGIGTTAPAATLQVSGSLIVSTSAQTTTPSLYVGTNGFVGVGTSAPTSRLELGTNGSADQAIRMWSDTSNKYLSLGSYGNYSGIYSGGGISLYLNSAGAGGHIAFDTADGGERMRVASSGNVGISTTTPNAKLDVFGLISSTNIYSGAASFTTVNANSFVGDGSGLTGVVASSGDRISSGTTSLLAVSNTGYVSLTQAGVNTGWFDPARGLVTLGVSATGGISGTSGYFSGNLGLGTAAPSAALHIYRSITDPAVIVESGNNSYPELRLKNPANNWSWILNGATNQVILKNNTTSGWPLIVNGDATTNNLVLKAGNVGIGTAAPSSTLHINGSGDVSARLTGGTWSSKAEVLFGDESSGSQGRVRYDNSADAMLIYANNAERLRINSSGNVGVGRTDPSATLDVSGTIKLAGTGSDTCNTSAHGSLRVNPSNNRLQICRP